MRKADEVQQMAAMRENEGGPEASSKRWEVTIQCVIPGNEVDAETARAAVVAQLGFDAEVESGQITVIVKEV